MSDAKLVVPGPSVRAGSLLAPLIMEARVIATEFVRAMAAAERYEELRGLAPRCDDPEASAARRVYAEFYRS